MSSLYRQIKNWTSKLKTFLVKIWTSDGSITTVILKVQVHSMSAGLSQLLRHTHGVSPDNLEKSLPSFLLRTWRIRLAAVLITVTSRLNQLKEVSNSLLSKVFQTMLNIQSPTRRTPPWTNSTFTITRWLMNGMSTLTKGFPEMSYKNSVKLSLKTLQLSRKRFLHILLRTSKRSTCMSTTPKTILRAVNWSRVVVCAITSALSGLRALETQKRRQDASRCTKLPTTLNGDTSSLSWSSTSFPTLSSTLIKTSSNQLSKLLTRLPKQAVNTSLYLSTPTTAKRQDTMPWTPAGNTGLSALRPTGARMIISHSFARSLKSSTLRLSRCAKLAGSKCFERWDYQELPIFIFKVKFCDQY